MSAITVESLSTNEALPSRSRTFSPEVVAHIFGLLQGANGSQPVQNVGIGEFDKEGGARSALASLNKLLTDQCNAPHVYAATVREQDNGKFKALLLNKPAKKKAEKSSNGAKPAATKS